MINMSIGGLPALNDGNNTRAVLYNRLIEQYKVQMFISAGNSGPGVNTIGDPSVAGKVLSVGSYISKDTWQKNYGSDSEFVDNLHYFTSRGPREDGGFKPNIVAPGSAISTVPTWQPGGPVPGTYTRRPATQCSTAPRWPRRRRRARRRCWSARPSRPARSTSRTSSTRRSTRRPASWTPTRFQAYDQGNGLMNVGAAWDLLKTNIKTVDITSSVKVNTVLSGFLATPGFGQGIYDREGVTAGQSYTRQYTFTRSSGGGGTSPTSLTGSATTARSSWPSSIAGQRQR